MFLAAHLGHASPTRMLEEMSPLDLVLWQAYAEAHPFGEIREDARHGIRSALFVQAHSKKGAKVAPADFIPKFESKRQKHMDWKDQLAYAEMLNHFFGGHDLRAV